jgi:signal transduction histidine kinase
MIKAILGKIRQRYSRLSLSYKIIIPFLIIFLTVLIIGVMIIGYWFVASLEANIRDDMNRAVPWVKREFTEKEEIFLQATEAFAKNKSLQEAINQQNFAEISRISLPEKIKLHLELLLIVDNQGKILFNLEDQEFTSCQLAEKIAIHDSLQGIPFFSLINCTKTSRSLLASIASIESRDKLLGGVIFARSFDNEILEEFKEGIKEDLVAFNQEQQIIASTLPTAKDFPWQPPAINAPLQIVNIGTSQYLAQTIGLGGFKQTDFKITLLHSITSLQEAKTLLWQNLWQLCLGGSLIVTVTGILIANMINRPLKKLMQVTNDLASGNLTVRLPITSQDELGKVSQAFNRMAGELSERDRLLNLQLHQLSFTLSELKQTQAQLIQAEKMSSLGQLVAGIAHEINNPVSFIYGNLEYVQQYTQDLLEIITLYQEYYPDPEGELAELLAEKDVEFISNDLPKLVNSMAFGAKRISQIVLSLRNFSRLDEAELKEADLHEGINNTLTILNHRLQDKVKLIKNYGDLPLIECYPAAINQAIMNIITNSLEVLETEEKETDQEPTITINTWRLDDQNIQIKIADNGPGIPADIQHLIFDPFFTTKPIGQGTGLGLSITYQIMQKHQGDIQVSSQLGLGTEFTISLPIKQDLPTAVTYAEVAQH